MICCIFNFLWNFYAVFHIDWICLSSHRPCTRVSFSSHPYQYFLCLIFLIISHSNRCEVIGYCGFGLRFPADYSFICLLATCISLEECVFSSSAQVLIGIFFFFCLFAISRAAPTAYGGSQARGPIGAAATGLHQSHSNAGSEPHLQPTPQLTATPSPQPAEQGQGSNPQPRGS